MIAALLSLLLVAPIPQADTVGRVPEIVTRAPIDTSAPVNFRVLATPDTVYVGEQATYELGVFLDGSVRDRLRRMEAIAPEMRGMMAYEPPAPLAGFPTRIVEHHHYEAHVYQRAIFPLTAGRLAIPPARLVYAMPLTYSFFSHEETYELRSDSAIIVAIEPPAAGRPAGWNGAVGTLHVAARVDSTSGRVGDPIVLTVTVAGTGNVSLFPRPRINIGWASAVPTVERVHLSADSLDIHGAKEFDWVLTPERPGRLVLPPVQYPYFDPIERRYELAMTAPMLMTIAEGSLASSDTGVATPRLALRSAYRGSLSMPPYSTAPFWWVVLCVPVPAIVLAVARRPRRSRRGGTPAQRLAALAHAQTPPPTRELRRAFVQAVGARIRGRGIGAMRSTASLAEPRVLARAARRAGVSTTTADAAAVLMDELNEAAFGEHGRASSDMAGRVARTYDAIDREACRPRVPTAAALLLLCILAAGAAGLRAADLDHDAMLFASGVDAYAQNHAAAAERDFGDIALRVPRAADAWANYGTAAFAAGDTAAASIGWQRALRLEPLASDVRQRLDLLGESSGIAGVPGVPATPLALVAALLWLGAWGAIGWQAARRRPLSRSPVITGVLIASLGLAGVAASIDSRLAARDLAVVVDDVDLHELPALGSDRIATVRPGEVARVVQRKGPWARIATDGRRQGWAAMSDLSSLARQ